MQIFIKTIIGKTITFDYEYNSDPLIYKLMQTVEKKIGIPVKYQRLQFLNKSLDITKYFSDYGINNNNTISQYSKIESNNCEICGN